eukprot:9821060-Ditylum_brightwellii.AAC.1
MPPSIPSAGNDIRTGGTAKGDSTKPIARGDDKKKNESTCRKQGLLYKIIKKKKKRRKSGCMEKSNATN